MTSQQKMRLWQSLSKVLVDNVSNHLMKAYHRLNYSRHLIHTPKPNKETQIQRSFQAELSSASLNPSNQSTEASITPNHISDSLRGIECCTWLHLVGHKFKTQKVPPGLQDKLSEPNCKGHMMNKLLVLNSHPSPAFFLQCCPRSISFPSHNCFVS